MRVVSALLRKCHMQSVKWVASTEQRCSHIKGKASHKIVSDGKPSVPTGVLQTESLTSIAQHEICSVT